MSRNRRQRAGSVLVLVLILMVLALTGLMVLVGRSVACARVDRWFQRDVWAEQVARSAVEEAMVQVADPEGSFRTNLISVGAGLTADLDPVATRELAGDYAGLSITGVQVEKERHKGSVRLSTGLLRIKIDFQHDGLGAASATLGYEAVRFFSVSRPPSSDPALPGTPGAEADAGVVLRIAKEDLLWERQ